MTIALTDLESAKAQERRDQWTRIMPIDFDRSPVADLGYSGWVQFEDGEIYGSGIMGKANMPIHNGLLVFSQIEGA